jgi:hypothetical protein
MTTVALGFAGFIVDGFFDGQPVRSRQRPRVQNATAARTASVRARLGRRRADDALHGDGASVNAHVNR